MVCQLPNLLGRPRHLQPCSATNKIAFKTRRLDKLTLQRWVGQQCSIRRYCVLNADNRAPITPRGGRRVYCRMVLVDTLASVGGSLAHVPCGIQRSLKTAD